MTMHTAASFALVLVLASYMLVSLPAATKILDFSLVNNTSNPTSTRREDRIYGGTEANIKKTPFIANLRTHPTSTHAVCGATLIAPRFLLTAAHCIQPNQDLFAAIGSEFAQGTDDDGEHFTITTASVHPKYNADTHENDVAILQLNGTSKVAPIRLAKEDGSDNKEGTMASVLGWGMTESGVVASSLEELDVRIISTAQCNKEYDGRIKETMLCAGEGGQKDTCQGDSGGPLIANNALIGCVSWGGQCGVHAGVYTRLSMMHEFIWSVVNGTADANANANPNIASTTAQPSATTSASTTGSGHTASIDGLASTIPNGSNQTTVVAQLTNLLAKLIKTR